MNRRGSKCGGFKVATQRVASHCNPMDEPNAWAVSPNKFRNVTRRLCRLSTDVSPSQPDPDHGFRSPPRLHHFTVLETSTGVEVSLALIAASATATADNDGDQFNQSNQDKRKNLSGKSRPRQMVRQTIASTTSQPPTAEAERSRRSYSTSTVFPSKGISNSPTRF